jgi:hypothetical protein
MASCVMMRAGNEHRFLLFAGTDAGWNDLAEQDALMSPDDKIFLTKSRAMSYLQHKRNAFTDGGSSAQGIVCECCLYRCSYGEMTQYCKAGFGKRGAPTPPHIWMSNQQEPASNTIINKDEEDNQAPKKISEIVLLTMFPEDKTTTTA